MRSLWCNLSTRPRRTRLERHDPSREPRDSRIGGRHRAHPRQHAAHWRRAIVVVEHAFAADDGSSTIRKDRCVVVSCAYGSSANAIMRVIGDQPMRHLMQFQSSTLEHPPLLGLVGDQLGLRHALENLLTDDEFELLIVERELFAIVDHVLGLAQHSRASQFCVANLPPTSTPWTFVWPRAASQISVDPGPQP